jgi:hypothetical protein
MEIKLVECDGRVGGTVDPPSSLEEEFSELAALLPVREFDSFKFAFAMCFELRDCNFTPRKQTLPQYL